jgi:hypothetical protein
MVENGGGRELLMKTQVRSNTGPQSTYNRHAGDGGAALLELAIVLPTLLLVTSILIYLATVLNARAALTTAVQTARFAVTRANPALIGNTSIPPVHTWKDATDEEKLAHWNALKPFLASKTEESNAINALNVAAKGKFGVDFKDLPLSHIYAIIYASQSFKQSVGWVRFPCRPETGDDCLLCMTTPRPNESVLPPQSYLAVECSYRPSGMLAKLIDQLLKVMGHGPGNPLIINRKIALDFT